jgi:hypothetical protein
MQVGLGTLQHASLFGDPMPYGYTCILVTVQLKNNFFLFKSQNLIPPWECYKTSLNADVNNQHLSLSNLPTSRRGPCKFRTVVVPLFCMQLELSTLWNMLAYLYTIEI